LAAAGAEVVLDDRNVSPGVKFADAELLGFPTSVIVGRGLKEGVVEVRDRASGEAVHFDCMAARVGERERPDKGESVVYLGGGRFGIVRFGVLVEKRGGGQKRGFSIKRIIEMEDRGERPAWRGEVADHFSVT